jgi:hypothetical protein
VTPDPRLGRPHPLEPAQGFASALKDLAGGHLGLGGEHGLVPRGDRPGFPQYFTLQRLQFWSLMR